MNENEELRTNRKKERKKHDDLYDVMILSLPGNEKAEHHDSQTAGKGRTGGSMRGGGRQPNWGEAWLSLLLNLCPCKPNQSKSQSGPSSQTFKHSIKCFMSVVFQWLCVFISLVIVWQVPCCYFLVLTTQVDVAGFTSWIVRVEIESDRKRRLVEAVTIPPWFEEHSTMWPISPLSCGLLEMFVGCGSRKCLEIRDLESKCKLKSPQSLCVFERENGALILRS